MKRSRFTEKQIIAGCASRGRGRRGLPQAWDQLIPLITRRSSTRALPRVSLGKCGSIFEN